VSILYPDSLPLAVCVDGVDYPIRPEFYIVLETIAIMKNDELPVKIRLEQMFDLFYKDTIPQNIDSALDALLQFVNAGSWSNGYQSKNKSDNLLDWEKDAPFIWASMKQTYPNWDFTHAHWFEFKACFDSLPDNCKINDVIRIRNTKITSSMGKEQREAMQELKQMYALPKKKNVKSKSPRELEAELKKRAEQGV
jgi:hypothetical protein